MTTRLPQSRRRFGWTGLALFLTLSGVLLASANCQTVDPMQPKGVAVNPDEAQKKSLAQLHRPIPSLTFEAVAFTDVIDSLRDISGSKISVNWKAVEAAGIDRKTPVSVNLRNIKTSKALEVILESVGSGQSKLGFTVDDGVITVSTQAELYRNVVTRVYDIRDLLVILPGFAYTREFTVPAPATQPVTRETIVQDITRLIMDTVSTDSWKDRGGPAGTLRELEGQLIITQTADNHREIVALLEQLRKERSTQIAVETRVVSCDPKIVDELLAQWGHSRKARRPEHYPTTRPSGTMITGQDASIYLDDSELAQLMKLIRSDSESVVTAAPRITLWNGQRAQVKETASTAYVSAYTPTTRGDGKVRYEPVLKSVDPGIVMDFTASVSGDHKCVTVSLHPQVISLLGFDIVPWPGSPKDVELMVQQPKTRTSELNTTVSMPTGDGVLLVAMDDPPIGTDESGRSTTQPSKKRGTYLLVRPAIVLNEPKPTNSSNATPIFQHN